MIITIHLTNDSVSKDKVTKLKNYGFKFIKYRNTFLVDDEFSTIEKEIDKDRFSKLLFSLMEDFNNINISNYNEGNADIILNV